MPLDPQAIRTRVGHTGTEELRFHGHRVFAELLGTTTGMQMLVCGITGRIHDHHDMLVVDDIVTAMSSADPRVWPFKITRLAAAYGSAASAVGVTLVASQGAIFGATKFQEIAEVLIDLHRRIIDEQIDDDQLLAVLQPGKPGFGVLYGRYDARFDALLQQAAKRGRDQHAFMQVCQRAAHIARTKLNVEPHVFVAIAALCLDMGMTPYQVGVFGMLPLFHDGLANATEGAAQQPAVLRRLRATSIRYEGRGRRKVGER